MEEEDQAQQQHRHIYRDFILKQCMYVHTGVENGSAEAGSAVARAEPVKPWLEPLSKYFLLYEYILNIKDTKVCSCHFGKNRLNSEDSD
ncbi:hypothetical protein PsorP6_014502 [Peronosclerospora sorghi]|uniref:Uncharacterized protein n=1 Tax=Peronosclerospora sorghi TaxID=230839 RepID=A0ACC0VSG0_9STRA|nr:hypothetical protein PsorP6_014502 [Peronosclerospora sorghi]